jgi:hypothetical protein
MSRSIVYLRSNHCQSHIHSARSRAHSREITGAAVRAAGALAPGYSADAIARSFMIPLLRLDLLPQHVDLFGVLRDTPVELGDLGLQRLLTLGRFPLDGGDLLL